MSNNTSNTGWSPSRRTVVTGAAWAVPAVVVASAAPAYALSGPLIPTYEPGTFCKHPPTGQYHGVFCFDNTTTESIVVTLATIEVTSAADVVATTAETRAAFFNRGEPEALVSTYTIPANTELCLYVDSGDFGNSQNGYAILRGSFVSGGTTYPIVVKAGKYVDAMPQGLTPCGTNPVQDQPNDAPPHDKDGPTVD